GVALHVALGHRVPGPAQFAGDRVEGAHHTAGDVVALIVGNKRPDNGEVADDGRRRGRVVLADIVLTDTFAQGHLAVVAEAGAQRTRAGIQSNQLGVAGAVQDATVTQLPLGLFRLPVGYAAAHCRIEAALLVANLGVEAPAFGAADRVQGKYLAEGRAV